MRHNRRRPQICHTQLQQNNLCFAFSKCNKSRFTVNPTVPQAQMIILWFFTHLKVVFHARNVNELGEGLVVEGRSIIPGINFCSYCAQGVGC